MTFEEKLQKRIGDIQAGCRTITWIPKRTSAIISKVSIRRIICDIVHDFLYEPKELPRDIYNVFKFSYQIAKRGFSDDEIWDLKSTLTAFITPRLKAFRNANRFGLPSELVPDEGDDTKYDKAEKLWCEILDKMIYAFEHSEDSKNDEGEIPDYKRVQEGFELFGKWYQGLWD